MNARSVSAPSLAVETATLGALTLAVYGGASLAVAAASNENAKLSFWPVLAVVLLSYGLARLLGGSQGRQRTMRLLGVLASLVLLYAVLRGEIAGDLRLWQFGWFADLVVDPQDALDGQAASVATVLVLGLAWVYGIARASREYSFEHLLADTGAWFLIVVLAAAFGAAADAPGMLRWLPVLYMVVALLALALAQLPSTSDERRDSFLRPWALWVGGGIAVLAGIASAASLVDPPLLGTIGAGIGYAARGMGLALAWVLAPFFIAMVWMFELFFGWLFADAEPFVPEVTDTSDLTEEEDDESGRPGWVRVFNYVARLSLLAALGVVVLLALWFAFRRIRRGDDEDELREPVEVEDVGPLSGMRSLFASALDRMRPGGRRPRRDAIGRLYAAVLARAADEGLDRPVAATPLEFAPDLDAHFASPLPGAISSAYSTARYGARPLSAEEAAELASRWHELPKDRDL